MAAQKGRLFVLKIWDASGTPQYRNLGGTTECNITIGNEQVDITDKFSNGNRESLAGAGTTTWSVSASGVVKDQTAYNIVALAAHENTQIKAQITNENGDVWECLLWDVTSFENAGGTADAVTFSISLESATSVSYTPSGGSASERAIIDPDA